MQADKKKNWSMPRMVGAVALATIAFIALAIAVPMLWQAGSPAPAGVSGPAADAGAPWQIESEPGGGSAVFGLGLGRSTLAEAARRWPDEKLDVALVRGKDGALSLEAYLESIQVGRIQGRMVLGTAIGTGPEADTVRRWAERAQSDTPLASGAHRLQLQRDDLAQALGQRIDSLVFLPSARLDEATLTERFGAPAERIATSDGLLHLLYPARGLAISLAAQGRQRTVMQYVAPRDFARLRDPLVAAPATPAQ